MGVLSDILLAADRGDVSALVLLDMTAAFDTVSHSILLQRLQSAFAIRDNAHRWFQLAEGQTCCLRPVRLHTCSAWFRQVIYYLRGLRHATEIRVGTDSVYDRPM